MHPSTGSRQTVVKKEAMLKTRKPWENPTKSIYDTAPEGLYQSEPQQSDKEGHGAVSEKVVFVSELIFSRDSKKAGRLDLKEGRRRVIEEGTGIQTKTKGVVWEASVLILTPLDRVKGLTLPRKRKTASRTAAPVGAGRHLQKPSADVLPKPHQSHFLFCLSHPFLRMLVITLGHLNNPGYSPSFKATWLATLINSPLSCKVTNHRFWDEDGDISGGQLFCS